MTSPQDVQQFIGRTADDSEGSKVGKIGQGYLDEQTGMPLWITDANRDAALSGEPISEEEHEVTLRAERPVVAKEAVPAERVRLTTDTVTEDAAVNETVRKERIEEPDVEGNPRDAGR